MNQRPFPKPPPVDPLPLNIWLDQTDRSEVGREPFFRGRDAEYGVYRSAVTSLSEGITGGGTMIFQGAPGAGKSALMQECMEAVRRHSTPEAPWVAVAIRPETLQSSVDVTMLLVEAANTEIRRLSGLEPGTLAGKLERWLALGRKLHGELSERGLGMGGVSVGGKPPAGGTRDPKRYSERVFRNAAVLLGNLHLVVLVDEAQNAPVSQHTKGVMDCLHHPPGGISLVAAFFGLSDTQDVLRQCGLSRFARGRVVNLEPLSFEEAACAIRSAFDAYGFPGTPADRDRWTTRLADLSQGWPQHLNSVSIAAVETIRANGGRIDSAGLDQAMAAAGAYRQEYYAARLAAGSSRAWVYRQMALAARENNGVLPHDDLRQFLTDESLDEFLTNALHAGLLAPVRDVPDHYRIPIPSFGDYLRELPVKPRSPEPGHSRFGRWWFSQLMPRWATRKKERRREPKPKP